MLRVHFMQQWFKLSDPSIEQAFFCMPEYRTRHTVCAVEFVRVIQQTEGGSGMSAPERSRKSLQGLKINPMGACNDVTLKDYE
jgi:hypothetical protein